MLPRDAQCLLAVELPATAIDSLLSVLARHRLASPTLSILLTGAAAARVEVIAPAATDASAAAPLLEVLAQVDGVAAVELYTLHRTARADAWGRMFARRLVAAWRPPTALTLQRLAA